MNIYNGFDLLDAVVFAIISQLGGLGPKYQDLVIYLHIGEGETLTQFNPRELQ